MSHLLLLIFSVTLSVYTFNSPVSAALFFVTDGGKTEFKVQNAHNESDTPPKTKQAESIGDISDRIEIYMGEDSKNLIIILKPRVSWSENISIPIAVTDMSKVLKAIKEKKPSQYSTVSFFILGNLVDKFGKERAGLIFATTYNMLEVEKINFENITDVKLMNNFTVGEVILSPAGRKVMAVFCSPENSLKDAQSFCLRALTK